MNVDLHIMLCVIFIFSTWVYFLKCEISDLHRRLDEHSGEHAYSTSTESAPSSAHGPSLTMSPVVSAGRKQVAPASQAPAHAHAGSASSGQRGGIPTWTIE